MKELLYYNQHMFLSFGVFFGKQRMNSSKILECFRQTIKVRWKIIKAGRAEHYDKTDNFVCMHLRPEL